MPGQRQAKPKGLKHSLARSPILPAPQRIIIGVADVIGIAESALLTQRGEAIPRLAEHFVHPLGLGLSAIFPELVADLVDDTMSLDRGPALCCAKDVLVQGERRSC
uniref:Uncharacterized protein n=1 Tax=Haptolina brevifila TaxID=156173 RepID=A0A7S2I7L0_9EUKA